MALSLHKSSLLILSFLCLIYHHLHTASADASKSKLPWKHLTYNETVTYLHKLQSDYPHLINLQSIGKSVQGRELWVARLSTNTIPAAANSSTSELD